MMCKNALETEWQQLHDHEQEPGHDTNAPVGESASKWFVHFELAHHQSASRWCWWFCTGSFVTSSSLFFCDDISEIRMIQNRQDQEELIGKSLCCWSLFHIESMMMVLLCVCSSVRAASLTAALASINDHTQCTLSPKSARSVISDLTLNQEAFGSVRMTQILRTTIFPDKYCRVVRLSVSRHKCPHVAPRISGSWSRWCSTTCRLTVTEKWRAEPSLA